MDKFSPFTVSLRLFHAQSLLGSVSLFLPFDQDYDELREVLFNASLAINRCFDLLSKIESND